MDLDNYKSVARDRLYHCKLKQKEIETKLMPLVKPTASQRRNKDERFAEYFELSTQLKDNMNEIIKLKHILKDDIDSKNDRVQSIICKVLKDNVSAEKWGEIKEFANKLDDGSVFELKIRNDENLIRNISLLKTEINAQLSVIKNIRKEMIFFMDIQERELSKSDFGKLIKDISHLNRSIPNELIINKKIVQISKY